MAAPSAAATLLASIVANLSTETVPARGLRVGEVHAIWSNTLCLPFVFVTLVYSCCIVFLVVYHDSLVILAMHH